MVNSAELTLVEQTRDPLRYLDFVVDGEPLPAVLGITNDDYVSVLVAELADRLPRVGLRAVDRRTAAPTT